jgi:hypothetical protein
MMLYHVLVLINVDDTGDKRNKKFSEELMAYFPFDTTRATLKTTRPTILLFLRVFVTAETFLPSRCLATIEGYTCRHTD